MITSIPIVCYSHSSYSDLWDMFFGQINKYFPDNKVYFFTDSTVDYNLDNRVVPIIYDDNLEYSDRINNCISNVKEHLFIYSQEDMILYDTPDYDMLEKIKIFVEEYNVDYIKFLKGGHHNEIVLEDMPIKNLYYIPHKGYRLSYTNQPTLWKTDTFKDIYSNLVKVSIKDVELLASDFINTTNIMGMYWFADEKKRGTAHWDSELYPFGNMVSKGKWVYSEYSVELSDLFAKYKIEKNIRGCV